MITLKTLHLHSDQEIFDQVKEHLLRQNKQSRIDEHEVCQYRCAGTKCAIGCLIADDEYKPEMEAYTIWTIIDQRYVQDNPTHILLHNLQTVHDLYQPHQWSYRLTELALELGLNP